MANGIPVITIQTIVGAKPDKTFVVLNHPGDKPLRQAIFNRKGVHTQLRMQLCAAPQKEDDEKLFTEVHNSKFSGLYRIRPMLYVKSKEQGFSRNGKILQENGKIRQMEPINIIQFCPVMFSFQ